MLYVHAYAACINIAIFIISPTRSAPSALRGADEVYRTWPTSRIPQRPPARPLVWKWRASTHPILHQTLRDKTQYSSAQYGALA